MSDKGSPCRPVQTVTPGVCVRVFAGYGVAGIGYKCATHGGIWTVCEDGTKCPGVKS